ncbi:glycosyl transferase family 2 [Calothrix sp. PCC 7716]|nr:glycosyl transferase family 2 [Calothrix sp. PCC 7716]
MSIQYLHREIIQPVVDKTSRPLWSVMIPTYNCAKYLRETLVNLLIQYPGSEVMQIEVVDDCSTKDDPEAVVREVGKGRVSFYRHPQNVGYIKNFNTCLQRSRGKLVHLLHGDDGVRYGFYQKVQQAFDKSPEIGAAFCRYISMDENGHWLRFSELEQLENGVLHNWLEKIAVINRLQPPSMVVRRDVYERLGGFDSRINCCAEDWEMWVRIAAHYPVWYEVEPLALYRCHSSSLTGRCACTGQNIRDLRKIIEIIQPYLPVETASKLSQQARDNWAIYGIRDIAPQLLTKSSINAVNTQIKESLKCSCSFKVTKELLSFLFLFIKTNVHNSIKSIFTLLIAAKNYIL